MIIDGMMHLEVRGNYWDELIDEVIEYYDVTGIDKGVVLTTWMPSRESNERTYQAYTQHPDRFIPFGHVRPIDEWQDELKRITQEYGWTGLKLHEGELRHGGPDIDKVTFATDGHEFSPLVELAKIQTLQLPTPYRTPRLTDEEMALILGGNMAKLLEL